MNPAMANVEAYRPLRSEEIRLLHLNPGKFDDELTCALHHVYLPENPSYEALSYTWGLKTSPISLYVDDIAVSITENLESALRHLRYEKDVRILWVDAVCINQSDMLERMAQVSQMDILYSKAEKTVIYLGDLDEESSTALDLMVMFSDDQHWNQLPIWTDASQRELDLKKLETIKRLWKYPWWNRVWVIQEVALANRIVMVCGKRHLSWDDIIMPATMILIKHLGECCKNLLTLENSRSADQILASSWHLVQNLHVNRVNIQQDSKPKILLLLKTYRERDATDPRDKIYGLLGMASDATEIGIVPDYSISWQEVYKRTAVKLIQNYHDPCLVAHQSLGLSLENEKVGLPSWAPDWSISHFSSVETSWHYWHARTTLSHEAGRGIPFLAVRIPNTDLLCLNGIFFDEIVELSDVMFGPEITPIVMLNWEQRIFSMSGGQRLYIGGGTWQEAYWQTVVADLIKMMRDEEQERGADQNQGLSIHTIASRFFVQLRYRFEVESSLTWPEPYWANGRPIKNSWDASKRLLHSFTAVHYRRFCVTKTGYFGTVPKETQICDSLHIFCAASTPLVLRKGKVNVQGKDKLAYKIVGDAYVHGVMNGEASNGGTRQLMKYLLY